MKTINLEKLDTWFKENYESRLSGRRLLISDIKPIVEKLGHPFEHHLEGYSFEKRPIYKISVGAGEKRILIWSQMHGNESTGTKALFDFFNFLHNPGELHHVITDIIANCTILCIPMLNPDGSVAFTRENAQGIDLNRDAVERKAKESRLLRKVLDDFNPQFCFNLHDQRTIFNVKGTGNPATISFLAPSEEVERKLTEGRKETMSVIVAMNRLLQQAIPNHVGRYTDEFYPSATGDNFQKLGHNTILIEAGHFANDYEREETRKYNFFALLQGIYFISNTKKYNDYQSYFKIPNNDKKFFDIIYRDAVVLDNGVEKISNVAVQIKYKVENEKLIAYEFIEKIGDLKGFYAHKEVFMKKRRIKHL